MFGIVTLIQLCYPAGKLLPFTRVDGMALGGVDRKEATAKLNTAYANHPIDIYMGSGTKPVTSPKLSTADMKVDNTTRLASLDYPWYLRIIPTSILWAGLKSTPVPAPTYGESFDDYIEKDLMPSCRQDPIDATLKAAGLTEQVMIDLSHANSSKQHAKQIEVAADVATQISAGDARITGVMIESHLQEGRQDIKEGEKLAHGVSVTDACISFAQTQPVLAQLAQAVQARRKNRSQ